MDKMHLRDILAEDDPELLFADGFDDAIIGITYRFGQEPIVLYDRGLVLESLMADGMTYGESLDFFEFNIIGSWVGERTPAFTDLISQPENNNQNERAN
jgi:hypothetical protein